MNASIRSGQPENWLSWISVKVVPSEAVAKINLVQEVTRSDVTVREKQRAIHTR